MSEWRPEGWPESPCHCGDTWCLQCTEYRDREVGADAILEALRGAGHYFGAGEAIDEPNFAPSGGRWMNQAGTMVFIPDGKENGQS